MRRIHLFIICLILCVQSNAFIDIIFTVKNLSTNDHLKSNFLTMISSLFEHTNIDQLRLHIIGDRFSHEYVNNTLRTLSYSSTIDLLNIDDLAVKYQQLILPLIKQFSSNHTYYKDPLFFFSLFLHRILPSNISRIIMLDIDLRFEHDIQDLYELFHEFNSTQIIGIARENQPVYRHLLWSYRQENPQTDVGSAPPHGLPGLNSGVLLLDLDKLRQSILFNSYLEHPNLIERLIEKYHFKHTHLGDQDFYTLLSFEYRDLFYFLPCYWNRQLCTWWKNKGYDDVWNEYYNCNNDESIYLYHGNCQTAIPKKLIKKSAEL